MTGQQFYRFRRFINSDGKIHQYGVDAGFLAYQLTESNLDRLIGVGRFISAQLGRANQSRVGVAGGLLYEL